MQKQTGDLALTGRNLLAWKLSGTSESFVSHTAKYTRQAWSDPLNLHHFFSQFKHAIGIKAGKDLLPTLLVSQSNRKRGKQNTLANSKDSYQKKKKIPELKYASKEFWKELKTSWIESISNNKELRWQPEKEALGKSEFLRSIFYQNQDYSLAGWCKWLSQVLLRVFVPK